MALFNVTPNDRRVYEEELKDFLPDKIFDVHTHVYLAALKDPQPPTPDGKPRTVRWPGMVAKEDSIEDLGSVESIKQIAGEELDLVDPNTVIYLPNQK